MITAFQRSGFQNNAFQIAVATVVEPPAPETGPNAITSMDWAFRPVRLPPIPGATARLEAVAPRFTARFEATHVPPSTGALAASWSLGAVAFEARHGFDAAAIAANILAVAAADTPPRSLRPRKPTEVR